MNFASLLKIHENRQTQNYYGNQYAINCNRKNDTPIVYGTPNYSGVKKRNVQPIEPPNQSLLEIYSSFEENSHVQWILQLQSNKVKIHKFKPSKIKAKKDEHQNTQKFQLRLYPQHKKQLISPISQMITEDIQDDFIQHQDHPIRERKNYSPMHQMKPKQFNQDRSWMENLNQNKFSFGDDSQQISEAMQQKMQQCQENIQNQSHMMDNDSQINAQNQSCIEERQDYEVQQRKFRDNKGVNLMREYEQFQKNDQQQIGENNDNEDKNQQQRNVKEKDEGTLFNPNVGFSFDQIEKQMPIQQNIVKNQPKENVMPSICEDELKENPPTDRIQNFSLKKQSTQKSCQTPKQPSTEQTKQTSLTLIQNTDVQRQQTQRQHDYGYANTPAENQSILNSKLDDKQCSPNRIYCKANVRNLTPQKFKYPRVDSKIHSNSNIQPFFTENDTNKNNTEKNIKIIDAKVQNVESQKLIVVPSSDRLLALIDESKRLLESRTVNDDKKNEDRIRRIVLYQPPCDTKIQLKDESQPPKDNGIIKTESKKDLFSMNDQQMQQKLTNAIQTAPKNMIKPQQQQEKRRSQRLTPQKKQSTMPSVSSPKSPLQQKPKFFNQLANIETNYTPEKTNLSPYTRYTENNVTQKQTSQFVPNISNTQQPNNAMKNTDAGQQNYLQTNYAYKPLNLPPSQPKQSQQKDTSIYRPPTAYQPHISPYQPTTTAQLYQPSVQPYSQFNNPSTTNQNPQIQTQLNQNCTTQQQVKTYSPYFPVSNTNNLKPSNTTTGQQNKANQVYQTYTYNGFTTTQQQNPTVRPLGTNDTNNYIKINTNYVSPLEKYQKTQQKDIYQLKVNGDVTQKENLRPVGLGIEGIKCVQSKIYEPKSISNLQNDPKETSIEFSLRIQEHFHLGTK